jgi:hypothetical protein
MFKSFGSIGNLFGSSGPQLNYDIGEQYTRAFGSWTHYRGTSKVRGTGVGTDHHAASPTPPGFFSLLKFQRFWPRKRQVTG